MKIDAMANENSTVDAGVLAKLRKLLALAKEGAAGERDNAERLLNALLQKHGLTLNAVDENRKEPHEFDAARKYHGLISNLFVNYFGGNERFRTDLHIFCYTYNPKKMRIVVDCTPWEFVEFKELCDFHFKNYEREWRRVRKTFSDAYIAKHNLYATQRNEWFNEMMAARREKEPDFEESLLKSSLAAGMQNVQYRKAIESGKIE